jgi:S-adenosylmethionine decarboxylase proenzyme
VTQLGRHLIIEMFDAENLNDAELLETALKETVDAIQGTLLDCRVVRFPVHGVTGVAIISESHVAVHTWPEYGYAAVDIFTCNMDVDMQPGIDVMKKHFRPGRIDVREVPRGILPDAVAERAADDGRRTECDAQRAEVMSAVGR